MIETIIVGLLLGVGIVSIIGMLLLMSIKRTWLERKLNMNIDQRSLLLFGLLTFWNVSIIALLRFFGDGDLFIFALMFAGLFFFVIFMNLIANKVLDPLKEHSGYLKGVIHHSKYLNNVVELRMNRAKHIMSKKMITSSEKKQAGWDLYIAKQLLKIESDFQLKKLK